MIGRPGRHDGSGGWPFIAMAASIFAIFGGLAGVTGRLGPASIPIWIIVIGGLVLASRGPIGQAIAARIHPREIDGDPDADLSIPQEIFSELDELRTRVAELEERQEFSERLLTRRAEESGPR